MNMMTKNTIQFIKGFVNLKDDEYQNRELAMMVNSELMQFGYILDKKALENISKASKQDITQFHNEVVSYLKDMTGSNRNYQPFWRNFPNDVMSKSELELWFHQIIHYFSNGTYIPNELVDEKPTAFEQPTYTKITAGNNDRFLNIFTDLLSVNQSLTPTDLKIVDWFIENDQELIFPGQIPFKENLCVVLSKLGLDTNLKGLRLTTTDVLRVAVYMSGGDISLPKVPGKYTYTGWRRKVINTERDNFKFKKFSRRERRFILNLLNQSNCDVSEAVLKQQRWVRLGEILHPGEYKNRYESAFKFFNTLRNDKIVSWYGQVNKSFEKSFEEGLNKLSERPGEFARRLDSLIRNNKKYVDMILEKFEDISYKISNKVIFELYQHFIKRNLPVSNRTIMVKGSRNITRLPDLPVLDQKVIDKITKTIMISLSNKFSQLDSLGNVWIDPNLKNIPLPTNMRSLNEALKPTIRGTRLPLNNKNAKVIRAFVHWFDQHGNEDIDLTAIFVGDGKVKHIGWNGSHNTEEGCYSGDVRHVQGPCAEYIDIDVKKTLYNGYKYVVLYANNYTGRPFHTLTDCVFGWMEREYPESNLTFYPKTLANTIKIQSDSTNSIIAAIDVETNEYIFIDIDTKGIPVASTNYKMMEVINTFCEKPKFSVYHLLELHAKSRGKIVKTQKSADTAFKMKDFSNDYINILKYMGV